MEKVVVELEAKTGKAEASLQDVVDAIKDINKATTESNKDTAKSLKEVEKSSSRTAKGIKRIGTAIKAAGLGLLLAAFSTLKEVFMQNQKAADFFNTSFEVVSIAFNDFVGFIDKNLGTITGFFKDVFENPTKKISELGSIIKQGLIDRFNQLLEVFGLVGKSLGQLVRGEFSAAFDTIKEAGKQTVDVVTGVDDSFEAVAETITEYTKKTIKAAKSNVELAKAAEIASVKNQGLIEKYDRQAEQQRQIRDDESKSIEDRIKANDELAKILDKQEEAMLKNADIAVASAKAELDKNKENVQLQKAYQEALNERAGIEAQITGFRSEQQTNTNSLLREQKEIMNEIALFGKSERDKERLELEQQYEANKLLIEKEITDDAEKKERLLAAETDYKAQLKVLNDGFDAEDLETKQLKVDKEIELEQKKTAAKYQALNDLQSIFGAESAMGKAALIGKQLLAAQELLIDLGVMKSKATKAIATASLDGAESSSSVATGLAKTLKLGFPKAIPALIGYAASAAAIIGGVISATKKTKSVASSLGGAGGGGGITPSQAALSIPPAFNVVGASSTDQLASAIGGQSQQPVQAYVVANDVTTAQSMDRNIIDDASLGD